MLQTTGMLRQTEHCLPMTKTPTVWLLLGDRVGDNNQVLRLIEALGWPYAEKYLKFISPTYRRSNSLLGARLTSLDQDASDPLQPPWPDLVISIGRRSVPVARWIREQSHGSTKLVVLGRPRARLGLFDLVISTPQYRVRRASNVLQIPTPLHGITEERLKDGKRQWCPRLAQLPRPQIALLVGGQVAPFRFGVAKARELGERANELAKREGGSLLVSTSSRTGEAQREALFGEIDVPSYLYAWRRNDPDNPYFGFLAEADAFVVTGDSVSMMTEALSTGRPVQIFSLPVKRRPYARFKEKLNGIPVLRWFFMCLVEFGIMSLPRDPERIKQALLDADLASELGQPLDRSTPRPPNSLVQVVARVRALFPEAH
ncbi:MAG: mitochondrial fission ELM1 family protein [Rhodovibrionaceae bacterium]